MENMTERMKIVALLDDLFFTSKIREASKPLNLDVEFIKNSDYLSDKIKSMRPSLIIIDLNSKSINALDVIRELKSSEETKGIRILGYLSHVQTDLRKEASDAGCDLLFPRSKFSRDLTHILLKYSA